MNAPKKRKSLQDILRERQKSGFVGREEQIELFRRNLEFSPEDRRRRFIFNVWGQGGVGKSTLLRQFRKIAEEAKIVTAYIDESERSVPEAMGRFAEQLEKQGHKLGPFSDRYKVYRQKKQELEADPEAPQGFSAFVGKSLAKTGMKLGRRIPGADVALEFVDEDAISTQAGEWAAYVAKKLGNKDEVRLIKEPEDVLTPLFLQEIGKVAEKNDLALFFDTYERTDDVLDPWLREVLEGRYGEVSPNILLVIAGRQELDENLWADYEGLIARLPLEPFTDEEAQQYLARKGITNSRVIEVILSLSGRLPLLVATLAAASPNDPEKVGDPSGTAVERFLKWEDDSKRRQVALDAALPRCLNRDILTQLNGEDEAEKLFDWLKAMPFVKEQTKGWVYHDVVRMQMLRHKHRTSPQSWADLHGKLAEYYDALRNGLELDEGKRQRDETWQSYTLEVLYHRLCQASQKHLPVALNEFLAALKKQRSFARQWAETMERAGKDAEVAEVRRWGERLVEGLTAYDEHYEVTIDKKSKRVIIKFTAYDEKRCEVTVSIFTELLKCSEVKEWWKAVAFAQRGQTYFLMKRYEDALKDFDRAIELDPEYQWVIEERGRTYRLMERHEEALKDFDRLIELDPEYDLAIRERGETYQAMERYEDALKDFDRVIELEPEYALAIADRGKTYRLMRHYEEALQDFDRAIELDFEYAWAIAQRGCTYGLMRHYEEALQDFDRAIELDSEYAWAIAQRGLLYYLMKRYEDALKDFDRAIELDPDSDWKIAGRGETYRLMERYEEALKDFDRAIELDPDSDWKIAGRGETYRLMERYENALKDFYRLIELDPENQWAIARRGETYRLMERYEDALKDFYRLIELDPEDQWAIAQRGYTYGFMERYDEALKDFDKAIELDPEYKWAIACRGEIYLVLQRYTEALADFNRAIESDADNDWRLYGRALAYQALNQPGNARTDLNRAIQLAQQAYDKDPEHWNNTFNLALYFLAAGNIQQVKHFYRDALTRGAPLQYIQEAIRDLEDFLRVFPQHKNAQAARRVLQKSQSNV